MHRLCCQGIAVKNYGVTLAAAALKRSGICITGVTPGMRVTINRLDYVIEDVAHHDGWYGAFEEKRVKELMAHASKTATTRLGQTCEKYLDGCPLYIKQVAVGDAAK